MRLILASASPRRAELLAAAGFSFEILAVDIDEQPQPGERPAAYVRRLAEEKSMRGLQLMQGARGSAGAAFFILGADTAVVIDGEILGKPENEEEARSMLRRLSGRRHEVLTGVSLRYFDRSSAGRPEALGSSEVGCVETTAVFFAPIGDTELEWYVQSREGLDKAGSYAIQGLASRFVQRIDGSHSNVVGLPVAVVHQLVMQAADQSI
jgi:nucleoside triphosphate pyrophosphatase